MAMRTTRQSVTGTLLQALDGYADADQRTFTIVNTNWALTPVELDAIGAVTIRNLLRTHLNRVGALGCFQTRAAACFGPGSSRACHLGRSAG